MQITSSTRHFQRGYLMEIPILLFLVGIVVAIVFPMLSAVGQKALLAVATGLVLFFLYYMIVTPGWMPGDSGRLKPPWNLVAFLFVAALLVAANTIYILS